MAWHLLLLLWGVQGHGFIEHPAARNIEAGAKNQWCPHCGNGAGVCGDGGQWASNSNYVDTGSDPVVTWTAGTIQEVTIRITAHHMGHFEFSICNQKITSSLADPQSCLDEFILERASKEELGLSCAANDKHPGCQPIDVSHPERFYLPPGSFSPDGSNVHTVSLKVPSALQCEHCTLQWRWWTANSCTPGEGYGCYAQLLSQNGYNPSSWFRATSCPGTGEHAGCTRCACGEEFRNCADIRVVGGSDVATTTVQGTTPATATTATTAEAMVTQCVSHETLICINGKSSYWPKCDPSQDKSNAGPAGYEFGQYCTQEWADALNQMLTDPAINKCNDGDAIHKLLAQVAYETGYYSTLYQPADGGAGLIHMIPGNWQTNAADMDQLFPGYNYAIIANAMGKDFFQTANYGWKSVAAWHKLTNRVIPGCGEDLFDKSYDDQTKCILSYVNDRSEAYNLVGSCLASTAPATMTSTTTTTTTTARAMVTQCVSHETLMCINGKSSFWPKCDPSQDKTNAGPAGYEFGQYCTQEWADALNQMLTDPAINKCNDGDAIHKLLAQVAYETGYYSTLYQPADGGAGLIHMIPGNWQTNAADMDQLFPGQNYASTVTSLGKSFFQTAAYGWKSAAAWYKLTNRVIPGCGEDLFGKSYNEQTRCILSRVNDRSEAYNLVGSCLASTTPGTMTSTTTTTTTTARAMVTQCVSHETLMCINGKSSFWPKCDPSQDKTNAGPAGYEFGQYCTQEWADALNQMLTDPAINKCNDGDAIHKLLAQVAYETGYYSTLYQPADGGAGLIHMIPGNWQTNAADMDQLFPGQNYASTVTSLGKSFFQTAAYGWKSAAAWYKLTNRVIPGCGEDLFGKSYNEQTRCILSRINDRSEAYNLVGSCLASTTTTADPLIISGCSGPTWFPVALLFLLFHLGDV
ncbi:unnamed protein product [Effrenium voratum]|uniref:Chitin-binding type-4 domain-containing protein n=1 Tax=Effrenium voratum TaxID=2562239 RepID=A0AA36HTL9_9DINO|nr:unnamed protein product [Effrenium voratum]